MLQRKQGQRRFFFHYNKHSDSWTIHWRGACLPVDHIECQVATEGHKQKIQPRRIVRGWATEVIVDHDKAMIR